MSLRTISLSRILESKATKHDVSEILGMYDSIVIKLFSEIQTRKVKKKAYFSPTTLASAIHDGERYIIVLGVHKDNLTRILTFLKELRHILEQNESQVAVLLVPDRRSVYAKIIEFLWREGDSVFVPLNLIQFDVLLDSFFTSQLDVAFFVLAPFWLSQELLTEGSEIDLSDVESPLLVLGSGDFIIFTVGYYWTFLFDVISTLNLFDEVRLVGLYRIDRSVEQNISQFILNSKNILVAGNFLLYRWIIQIAYELIKGGDVGWIPNIEAVDINDESDLIFGLDFLMSKLKDVLGIERSSSSSSPAVDVWGFAVTSDIIELISAISDDSGYSRIIVVRPLIIPANEENIEFVHLDTPCVAMDKSIVVMSMYDAPRFLDVLEGYSRFSEIVVIFDSLNLEGNYRRDVVDYVRAHLKNRFSFLDIGKFDPHDDSIVRKIKRAKRVIVFT